MSQYRSTGTQQEIVCQKQIMLSRVGVDTLVDMNSRFPLPSSPDDANLTEKYQHMHPQTRRHALPPIPRQPLTPARATHPQGFAGRLQLAKPSMYACSALDPPAKAPSSRLPTTAVVTTQNSSSDEASSTSTTATAAAGDEKHGAIRRGWGKRTGRATHNAVPIATSRHQVFGAVSSAGGEEELPSAVLISRSIKDDTAGCTFEAKVCALRRGRDFQRKRSYDMIHTCTKYEIFFPEVV